MRNKILEDLKTAMKNQDKESLDVIRMIKGAMQLVEINLKRELNDSEMIELISKQIKTRKESISDFIKGNRQDLIDKTNIEIEILSKYLPKQLSIEEVEIEIQKLFDEIKPNGIKDMGTVMSKAKEILNGKTDMSLVSKMIKEKLN